jgi:hypothetical protein
MPKRKPSRRIPSLERKRKPSPNKIAKIEGVMREEEDPNVFSFIRRDLYFDGICQTKRTFRPNCPLLPFLTTHFPELELNRKRIIFLREILLPLQNFLLKNEYYDVYNQAIIVLPEKYKNLFDKRFFRVSELPGLVCSQLVDVRDDSSRKNWPKPNNQKQEPTFLPQPGLAGDPVALSERKGVIPLTATIHASQIFQLSSEFRDFMEEYCDVPKTRCHLTYADIILITCQFIKESAELFFLQENNDIAVIQGHPLSRVFRVDTFHLDQVNLLTRAHLRPAFFRIPRRLEKGSLLPEQIYTKAWLRRTTNGPAVMMMEINKGIESMKVFSNCWVPLERKEPALRTIPGWFADRLLLHPPPSDRVPDLVNSAYLKPVNAYFPVDNNFTLNRAIITPADDPDLKASEKNTFYYFEEEYEPDSSDSD